MKERTTQFGPGAALAGIVTAPATGAPRRGCVLVSAGLIPKAGPYRLYAELARRLAEDGVVTLRFDLGDIGDSVSAHGDVPLRERTALELAAAVDYLSATFALDELTLGGLCSGAEDSLRGAAAHRAVTDVVMIDPFAYRTSGWLWRHALHRTARRALRAFGIYEPLAANAGARAGERAKLVEYHYMEREESARILRELVARQARVHFFYTAGVREAFNHPSQLRAAFPDVDFADRVTLDYFPHMDHTQLLAADRRTLVDAIARRVGAPS